MLQCPMQAAAIMDVHGLALLAVDNSGWQWSWIGCTCYFLVLSWSSVAVAENDVLYKRDGVGLCWT